MKNFFLKIFCLALLALAGPLAAEDKPLPVADGLTITVGTDGVMQLVWNPIYDDNLMGYSIWKRVEGGTGDYTRISIPFKSGKEIKKLPMTAKARYLFRDAPGARMEYVVISEFESGRSQPSAAVRTRLARKMEVAMAPTSTGLSAGSGASAASAVSPSSASTVLSPGLSSIKGEEEPEGAPKPSVPLEGMTRTLLAPAGSFHTSLGLDLLFDVTNSQGHNSLDDLGITIVDDPGYDTATPHNWTMTGINRVISLPLSLEYGVLPALEIGASIPYRFVYSYVSSFNFGSDTFHSYQDQIKMSGSGFANLCLQVRLQPVPTLPLILSLKATLPTVQRTRLQAWNDFIILRNQTAGLDDGTTRIRIGAEFGQRGVQPGIFYMASYMPSASENSTWQDPDTGETFPTRMNFGQQVELGVGYTFPWAVNDKPGAATTWLTWRSIDAGQWFFDNADETKQLSSEDPYRAGIFRNFTGVNPDNEDQLEWGLGLSQNIFASRDRHGVIKYLIDSQGKLTAVLKPNGYIVGVSGGLYY